MWDEESKGEDRVVEKSLEESSHDRSVEEDGGADNQNSERSTKS